MRPRNDMTQSAAAKKARVPFNRKSVRAQVVPTEIRGIATVTSSGEHLPFLVWDVSADGMGLWVSQPLKVGDKVRIAVGQPYLVVLEGEIVWSDENAEANGYRCGVKVVASKEALVGLYEKFGG